MAPSADCLRELMACSILVAKDVIAEAMGSEELVDSNELRGIVSDVAYLHFWCAILYPLHINYNIICAVQADPFSALDEALNKPVFGSDNAPKLADILDNQVIPGAANAVLYQFSFGISALRRRHHWSQAGQGPPETLLTALRCVD